MSERVSYACTAVVMAILAAMAVARNVPWLVALAAFASGVNTLAAWREGREP